MHTHEMVILAVAFAVTAAVMVPIIRYARRRVAEADELAAKGWICVGCNFLTGPIMAPPTHKTANA